MLLVPGHTMPSQQVEKVPRRVARQGRAAKAWIIRKVIGRAGLQVGEITPPAPGYADFFRKLFCMVDKHHASPQLAGDRGTHHPGSARADHGNIEMFHGAHCNRGP